MRLRTPRQTLAQQQTPRIRAGPLTSQADFDILSEKIQQLTCPHRLNLKARVRDSGGNAFADCQESSLGERGPRTLWKSDLDESPAISYCCTEVIGVVTASRNDSSADEKMDGYER